MKRTVEERFWAKVNKTSSCWLWTGVQVGKNYRIGKGYGIIKIVRKNVYVHRYSYQLHIAPVPAELDVLHTCDVTICVNPAHLFLGTQQDNVADRERKGRGWNGSDEKHGNAKLTEAKVLEIFSDSCGGMTLQQIADKHNMSKSHMCRVLRKENWAHLWR